jgi:hypothetical protein
VLRVLAWALERLMGVANRVRVKEGEEPDDDIEVPDDLASELDHIGEPLEDMNRPISRDSVAKTVSLYDE